MFLEINTEPFAPIVGYAGALIASVYAIWTLIWRRKVWETPQNILPSTIKGLIAVVLSIGVVWLWLKTEPNTINEILKIAVIFVIIAFVSFILYYAFIQFFSYNKEVAKNNNETENIKILGGLWLTKTAKESIKSNNIRTVQELFKGSAYNIDELWSRFSQEILKAIIVIFYLLIVTGGTLGLSATGFIVQVKLTNKPAYETTSESDSPGLETTNKE